MSTTKKSDAIHTACIVLPTYNEAKNIKSHLDAIFKQTKQQKKIKFSVLVVDDSSPDGTADIVQSYKKKNKNVHLLLRKEKEGLGKAYIAGMLHAIETLKPDVVYEMDSDGQHNPKDLLRLLDALTLGADFAIGSRYIKGGTIPKTWGLKRKIISSLANFITTLLLGVSGVRDISGGFRAIRTTTLKEINLQNLNVRGYAFQAVILEAALHHGAIVTEIPIAFNERELGDSKMTIKDMLEPFGVFMRIRIQRLFKRSHKQTRIGVGV